MFYDVSLYNLYNLNNHASIPFVTLSRASSLSQWQ